MKSVKREETLGIMLLMFLLDHLVCANLRGNSTCNLQTRNMGFSVSQSDNL